jgi:hypothetical protein
MRIRIRTLVRLESQKVEFLDENIIKVGKRSKNIPTKAGLFESFGQFPCFRIRNHNTEPVPGIPNEGKSRRIRIHNTGL